MMTIEEKAKAYDEALGRAKASYGTGAYDDTTTEFIFPEITETDNKDERIRKFLIDYFGIIKSTLSDDGIWKGFQIEEILAFLEKQKEQKPELPKPHKGDDTNPYDMQASEALEYAIKRGFGVPFNDGEVYVDVRHMTQTIGNIIRWADEHPKEQKPAEWSYPYGRNETADRLVSLAECLEMDGDCLFNGHTGTECGKFLRDLARKQVECKPVEWNKATINGEPIPTENHSVNIPLAEWSKEDEALFELLHQCVCRCINDDRMDYSERYNISKTMIPFIEKLQTLHPQQQAICDEKYVPSREMILAIWELGYVWKETNTTGITQREYIQKHWKESSYYDKLKSTHTQPHTVSIKDATKFGNLEYERGVKDGIQHAKNHQWKPSDEQIEALEWMLTTVTIKDGGKGVVLKNLVNDLKKQM